MYTCSAVAARCSSSDETAHGAKNLVTAQLPPIISLAMQNGGGRAQAALTCRASRCALSLSYSRTRPGAKRARRHSTSAWSGSYLWPVWRRAWAGQRSMTGVRRGEAMREARRAARGRPCPVPQAMLCARHLHPQASHAGPQHLPPPTWASQGVAASRPAVSPGPCASSTPSQPPPAAPVPPHSVPALLLLMMMVQLPLPLSLHPALPLSLLYCRHRLYRCLEECPQGTAPAACGTGRPGVTNMESSGQTCSICQPCMAGQHQANQGRQPWAVRTEASLAVIYLATCAHTNKLHTPRWRWRARAAVS